MQNDFHCIVLQCVGCIKSCLICQIPLTASLQPIHSLWCECCHCSIILYNENS